MAHPFSYKMPEKDAAPAMVEKEPKKIRRTRDGCLVCRSFKKGCTKERPACARCVRLGYVCKYPDTTAPYPKVGSKIELERMEEIPNQRTSPVPSTSQLPLPGAFECVSPSFSHLQMFQDMSMLSPTLDNYLTLPSLATNDASMPFSLDLFKAYLPQNSSWPPSLVPALIAAVRSRQYSLISGICASAYWMNARPDILAGLFEQMQIKGSNYSTFGDVFLAAQSKILPIQKLLRLEDEAIPEELDLILQERASHKMEYHAWQQSENSAWQHFNDSNLPLEERLAPCQDLAYYALYTQGAAAFDRYQDAMIQLALEHFSPQIPFDIGSISITDNFAIGNVIWADILQSITRTRAPSFNYVFQRNSPGSTGAYGLETMTGALNEASVLLAQISKLASELGPSWSRQAIDCSTFSAQVQILEAEIANIPTNLIVTSNDSLLNISQLACQEVWRQATLIHFYQAIYGKTAKDPELRKALRSILKLLKVVEMELETSLHGQLALPIFLAATIAESTPDRDTCRYFLRQLGNSACYAKEATALIDKLWGLSDEAWAENRRPVDFRQLGSKIAFF